MPTLTLDDGLALHYRLDGNSGGPTVVFSNSLGTGLRMWEEQAAALGDTFQVVRYETRGHGASGVPAGPATLDSREYAQSHGLKPLAKIRGMAVAGVPPRYMASGRCRRRARPWSGRGSRWPRWG